jgi:hypothetical protein
LAARARLPISAARRVDFRLHQKLYISGEDSQARCCSGSGRLWMMVAAIAPPQLASSTSGARPPCRSAAYMPM